MTIAQGVAANRGPITVSIMLATIMNSIDTTIANVALPHMAGSVSASADQITWVLTSYIIAAAIMTPLAGWLADRIGRKRLFLISIAGFTVASMLCGIANSLVEIVGYRLLQGVFGASLIPIAQAILLDINPPEKHGQAMAVWGMGALLGPIIGPALGGWLTEQFDWRWCFLINLPIGILAFLGVWFFSPKDGKNKAKPFDFVGFGAIVAFIGAVQMMLDRGPSLDWFDAGEIQIYAIIAAISLWVFVIHTATATHPFFDRQLMRDRNFLTACIFGFFIGILLFSTMALVPPMMQTLMGYPVLTAGLVSMPRGFGSFFAMFVVGQLIGKVDTKLILLAGLSLNAFALWQMTQFDLSMDSTPFIISGIFQGFGIGLIFVPLSTLAFATIAPHLRAEGSSVYTLIRNLGAAVGISIMQALMVSNMQSMHESIASKVNPSDPVVSQALGAALSSPAGLAALNGEVTRQATMVAFIDDFQLMLVVTLLCMPMLLLLKSPPKRKAPGPVHVEVD
jgi:MFS transporter, DHA2 family, multidrug resistance protein